MGRGGTKNVLQTPKEDIPKHQLGKEESQQRYILLCQANKYEGHYLHRVGIDSPEVYP